MVLNDIIEQAAGRQSGEAEHGGKDLFHTLAPDYISHTNTPSQFAVIRLHSVCQPFAVKQLVDICFLIPSYFINHSFQNVEIMTCLVI